MNPSEQDYLMSSAIVSDCNW